MHPESLTNFSPDKDDQGVVESRLPQGFIEQFAGLSDLNNPEPLKPEILQTFKPELFYSLESSGLRLGEVIRNRESMSALAQKRFDVALSGRDPAIIIALDGKSKFDEIRLAIQNLPSNPADRVNRLWPIYEKTKTAAFRAVAQINSQNIRYPNPQTNRRGWEQLLLDTVEWGIDVIDARGFAARTNWRIARSYEVKLKRSHQNEQIEPMYREFQVPPSGTKPYDDYKDLARLELGTPKLYWSKLMTILNSSPDDLQNNIPELGAVTRETIIGNDMLKHRSK